MATILFTWELGQGLGHLAKVRRLGDAVERRGHRILVASQNVVTASRAFPAHWPIYQAVRAPTWTPPPGRSKRIGSFADILQLGGFGDLDIAVSVINAWNRLFDDLRPDVLVAESSPTALAAALGRVPSVVAGNGYAMPPSHLSHFPPLTPAEDWLAPHDEAFAVLNEALERTGRPTLPWLPRLMQGDLRICDTYAGLDPYADQRIDELYGSLADVLPLATDVKPGKRLFAYLSTEYPHFDKLITAIAGNGERFSLYIGGSPTASVKEHLRKRGAEVYDKPAPFAEVLPAACGVLGHGTMATSLDAMTVGRPQILVPFAFERKMIADHVVKTGAGCILKSLSPGIMRKAIANFVDNRQVATRALQVGADVHRSLRRLSTERCADGVEEVLRNHSG